jgi:hypothetical protein
MHSGKTHRATPERPPTRLPLAFELMPVIMAQRREQILSTPGAVAVNSYWTYDFRKHRT